MADAPTPLVLDLVEWLSASPKPYAEVMEAWRTSCPRLTVWEDAQDQGFIRTYRDGTGKTVVAASAKGVRFLRSHGRSGGRRPATPETKFEAATD